MKFKKTLAILLSILVLAGVFSACGSKKTPTPDETTPNGGTILNPDDTEEVTEKYVKDDLPESLKYNNAEFHILCDQGQYSKSFVDTYTGDVINSALFNRLETVQDRLDIDIWVDRAKGAYGGMEEFTQTMVNMGADCGLVLAYNMTPALMATQGLISDLASTEYLNFQKPWWSSTLLENTAINGKVYFTADNSSWNNLRNMLGIFVNKQMFEVNHPGKTYEDLYDMVDGKEWTMSEMFDLSKDIYFDLNTNNTVDQEDRFGLTIENAVWTESIYFAAGFIALKQNDQGTWEFNIASPQVVDFIDWFQSKFYNSDSYTKDPAQYKQFRDGRALFALSTLGMVEQGIDHPFAVLPIPMYQTEQGRYYTHFSNTYDMYAIPKATADPSCSSAVLECLASEAYRQIAPAYFETYLKVQKSSDDRLAQMYDLIRESIVFDTGVLYGAALNIKSASGGDRFPHYYVRWGLNKQSGLDKVADSWPTVSEQFEAKWNEILTQLGKAE